MLNKTKEIKNGKSIYKDEEGYMYLYSKASLGNVLYRKTKPNRFFRNKFTKYNMKNYLKVNGNSFILLSGDSEIRNATSHTKLTFSCFKHGVFYKDWNSICNSQGCQTCNINKRNSSKRNKIEKIRKNCLDRGLVVISKNYGNNNHILKLKCIKHNEIIFSSYQNIMTNTYNCNSCLLEAKAKNSEINFYKRVKKNNISNPEVVSYTGKNDKYIVVRCKKCGYKWELKKGHFFNGSGCPICATKSKGEDKIAEILIDKDINFTRQKRYNDCKHIRTLPFDFYLDDYNILIEYDGKQHYVGHTAFGGTETLKNTQFHDNIKNKYCKDNNIKLIRIPHWDFRNIEKILSNV